MKQLFSNCRGKLFDDLELDVHVVKKIYDRETRKDYGTVRTQFLFRTDKCLDHNRNELVLAKVFYV